MDLTSGPFCYIAYVAESFQKTEKDLESLENTLRTLHREIELYVTHSKDEGSSSKVVATFERLKSSKTRCSSIRAKSSHGTVIVKPGSRKKIQRKPILPRKHNNSSSKDYPHWFVRVIEFYMSITKAFSEVRKYLKKTCRKYATAMVTFIRVYKESTELTPENLESEIDSVVQNLHENYEKRLKGMNNMIRLCEHQKSAMLENRTKIQSEVEITTLEILCIKETTSKILPTVTVQEEQLQLTSDKALECEKQFHEVMVLHSMLSNAKRKLSQERSKSEEGRRAFLEELRKRKEELMNLIAIAEMEIEEKRLKLMREKETIESLASTTRYLSHKMVTLQMRKGEVESEKGKVLKETSETDKSLDDVAEKERKAVFLYQTICVTSHKHRTDLKNLLAKNIRKLQNILLMYSLKKNMMLTPIENEIIVAREDAESSIKKLEMLEDTYSLLYKHSACIEKKLNKLNSIMDKVQRRFEEIDISLFMLENGYQTVHMESTFEGHTHQECTEEELNDIFQESDEDTLSESADELDRNKYYSDKMHKGLSTLRQKERTLEKKIFSKKRKMECIQSNLVKFGYVFLSITSLPIPLTFVGSVSHVSSSKKHKKLMTSTKLPDILLPGKFPSVETTLVHHRDESSSKSSSKSKRRNKGWTKFEETLRRNLLNEFQRLIEAGDFSEQLWRNQSTDIRSTSSSNKNSKKQIKNEKDQN